MIDVDDVLQLHATTVSLWHEQAIENPYSGVLQLVCQQHSFNFELWHQEDIARSRDVTDEMIAKVKREIDRLNQARNDFIEKVDDWLTESLGREGVQPLPDAKLNTETPGSAIDRLSIMSLRIFHYEEQMQREEVDEDHRKMVEQRTALCKEQLGDLSQSLRELLAAIVAGTKLHKTYRQMKMYNDPKLNPYLYAGQKTA